MTMLIDPNWTFEEVVRAAYSRYTGSMQFGRPNRNRTIKNWANVVGRRQAIAELERFIAEMGGRRKVIEWLGMAPSTFRGIEKHFHSVPEHDRPIVRKYSFELGGIFKVEEDLHNELKEIMGRNPSDSITNTVDEYAVAFLNESGGRIYWGIRNEDHVVTGVQLTLGDRDKVRTKVMTKLATIQPQVTLTSYKFEIHPIFEDGKEVDDLVVVEVIIPKGEPILLHQTGGGEVFLKVQGGRKKLTPVQIQKVVLDRYLRASSENRI